MGEMGRTPRVNAEAGRDHWSNAQSVLFAGGGVKLGKVSRAIDSHVIDGVAVNGTAKLVDLGAQLLRKSQSGYLYHYAFAMIVGLILLLGAVIKFWQ